MNCQPKTVEEAVDRMQYFKHSRQSRLPKPKREAVRAVADKDKEVVDSQKDGKTESEIRGLKSRMHREGWWRLGQANVLNVVRPGISGGSAPPM